jgi:hypothetical protein
MTAPAHHTPPEATAPGDPARRANWPAVIIGAAIGLLVVAMIILHLVGTVGPGAH